MINTKMLYRPDEVKDIFQVSLSTIYRWCDEGLLEAVKIRGTRRVKRESIEKLLEMPDE
jgi:excisionase family DNA binding protein